MYFYFSCWYLNYHVKKFCLIQNNRVEDARQTEIIMHENLSWLPKRKTLFWSSVDGSILMQRVRANVLQFEKLWIILLLTELAAYDIYLIAVEFDIYLENTSIISNMKISDEIAYQLEIEIAGYAV